MLEEKDLNINVDDISEYLRSQATLSVDDEPYHYRLPLHELLRKAFLYTALAFLGATLVSWGVTLLPHILSPLVLFIIGVASLIVGYAVTYVFIEDMFATSYKEARLLLGVLALSHSISWSAFVVPFLPMVVLTSFVVLAVMYGVMSMVCKWQRYGSMTISLYAAMVSIGLAAALLTWWISGANSFVLGFCVGMVLANVGLLYYLRAKLQWMCQKADTCYQGKKACVMGALLIHSGLELVLVHLYNAWCDNESD